MFQQLPDQQVSNIYLTNYLQIHPRKIMEPQPNNKNKRSLRKTQTPRSPSQNSPKENQSPNKNITPGKSKQQGKKYESQIKPQNRPNSFSFQNSKEQSYQERSPNNDDQDIESNNHTTIRNVPMTRSIITTTPQKSPAQQKNKQGAKMKEQEPHPDIKQQSDMQSYISKNFPGSRESFQQKKMKEKQFENGNKSNKLGKNTNSEIKPHSTEIKLERSSSKKDKSETQSNLQKMKEMMKESKEKIRKKSSHKGKDGSSRPLLDPDYVRQINLYNEKPVVSPQKINQKKEDPKSQKKIQEEKIPQSHQQSNNQPNNQSSQKKVEQKSSPKSSQQLSSPKQNPKSQKKVQSKSTPKSPQQSQQIKSQKKIEQKLQSPKTENVNNNKSSPKTNEIKSPSTPKDNIKKEEQKAQVVNKTPQQKDERLSTPPRKTQSNKSEDKLLLSSGNSQSAYFRMTPNSNQSDKLNLGFIGVRHQNSNNSSLILLTSRRTIKIQKFDIKRRRQHTKNEFQQIIGAQFHLEYPSLLTMIEGQLTFTNQRPARIQQFRQAFPQRQINNVQENSQDLLQQWRLMAEDYRRELSSFVDILNEKNQQDRRKYPARGGVLIEQKHQEQGQEMVEKDSVKYEGQENEVQKVQPLQVRALNGQNSHNIAQPILQPIFQPISQPIQQPVPQPIQQPVPRPTNEAVVIPTQTTQPKPNKKQGKENQSPNNNTSIKNKAVHLASNDQQRIPNQYTNRNNANLRNSIKSSRSSNKLSYSNNKKVIKKQIQGERSQKRVNKTNQQRQKKSICQNRVQHSIKEASQRCEDMRELLSQIINKEQHEFLREYSQQLSGMLEIIQEGLRVSRFQKKLQAKNLRKCKQRIAKLQLSLNQSYDFNFTIAEQIQEQYKRTLYQRKVQQLISEEDRECFQPLKLESLDDYYMRHNQFKQPYYSEISNSEDQNINASFSGQENMNQRYQNPRQNNNSNLQGSQRNNFLQQSFGGNNVEGNAAQNRGNFSFEMQNNLGSFSPSIGGVHGNVLDSPIQGLSSQRNSPHQGSNSNIIIQGTPQLGGGSQNVNQRQNSSGGVPSPVFGIKKKSPPPHMKGSNYNHNNQGTPRQNKNNIKYEYLYGTYEIQHEQQNERMNFKVVEQKESPNPREYSQPKVKQQQMKENQVSQGSQQMKENEHGNCKCRNKIKITDVTLLLQKFQKIATRGKAEGIPEIVGSISNQNIQKKLLKGFKRELGALTEQSIKTYSLAKENQRENHRIFEQGIKHARQSTQLRKQLQTALCTIANLNQQVINHQNNQRNQLSPSQQVIVWAIPPENQYRNTMHVKDTMQLLRQLQGFITEGKLGDISLTWRSVAQQSIHPQLFEQLKQQFQKTLVAVSSRFYVQQELTSQKYNQMNQLLQKMNQPMNIQADEGEMMQRRGFRILKSPVAGVIDDGQMVQGPGQQQVFGRQTNARIRQAMEQRQRPLQPERENLGQSMRRSKVQRIRQSRRRLQHRSQPQPVAQQQYVNVENRQHPSNGAICRRCESVERIAQDRRIFENKLKIKDVNAVLQWLLVLSKQCQYQDSISTINTMRSIMKQKIDPQFFDQFKDLLAMLTTSIKNNIGELVKQDNQITRLKNIIRDIGQGFVLKDKKSKPDRNFCQIILNQTKNVDDLFRLLSASSNNQGQIIAKVLQYRMMTICEFLGTCLANYPQEYVTNYIKVLQIQDVKIRNKLMESGLPTTRILDEAIDSFLSQLIIDQKIHYLNDHY